MSFNEEEGECSYLLSEFNVEEEPSEYSFRRRRKMGKFRDLLYCLSLRCCFLSFWRRCCCSGHEWKERTIFVGEPSAEKFPANVIRNQKYNILTFLPMVLFQQFKFFLNLYFLVMALSQLVPALRLGYLYTYWGPLGFVLAVTIIREAVDDLRRHQRDKEVNSQKYKRLVKSNGAITIESVSSSKLRVGDLVFIEKDQRVPADLVLLRTTERTGSCFIRTDQLDGETDWKLRIAVRHTQKLDNDNGLFDLRSRLEVEKPWYDIHNFIGVYVSENGEREGLTVENTLWANTVLASGTALGAVLYTGSETRSVMNNSAPRSKTGLLDIEINRLTKVLFFAVLSLALVMMILKGFAGPWYKYMFRFTLLFSYIIPLSLRVNLDMSKAFYSWQMQRDPKMPGCVVRCTTIPEELGRISYLLSDKTGTLTQNSMVFKKLHSGAQSYGENRFQEIKDELLYHYKKRKGASEPIVLQSSVDVHDCVHAIALCHNVTPVYENDSDELARTPLESQSELDNAYWAMRNPCVSYQASSPDEVALVKWSEEVGLAVTKRDISTITLRTPANDQKVYTILQIFPFTSETKRMGIIVKDNENDEITFYMKGADVVMSKIVKHEYWLDEEVSNMAMDGLRTLVVARKRLSQKEYDDFETKYNTAKAVSADRNAAVSSVVGQLERDMQLLCITGVEDKLQENVRHSIEILHNAGIKIWMLTGDKQETAICIAKSSLLVSQKDSLYEFKEVQTRTEIYDEIQNASLKPNSALVITGTTLEHCLRYYKTEFLNIACRSPTVVCCRCSPTQKAQVVKLIQEQTGKRTAAVGDGGNDVSMIQAADTGIGIAGIEGKQASLAADFSITSFSQLPRLLLVHGRHSYKRSSALSQFVIHRGLIISTMQAIFSAVFYFSSVSLFPGFFMVGYATIYTMFPVFSLVLDRDLDDNQLLKYPDLYKDLSKGRSLSFKTFFQWVLVSIIQGGAIMYGALVLFEDEFIHIVAISFTALILTELIMVALTVRTWHYLMVLAQIFSLATYVLTLVVLRQYFDPTFLQTPTFLWKVLTVTAISCLPLAVVKILRKKYSPPSYSKLS